MLHSVTPSQGKRKDPLCSGRLVRVIDEMPGGFAAGVQLQIPAFNGADLQPSRFIYHFAQVVTKPA